MLQEWEFRPKCAAIRRRVLFDRASQQGITEVRDNATACDKSQRVFENENENESDSENVIRGANMYVTTFRCAERDVCRRGKGKCRAGR